MGETFALLLPPLDSLRYKAPSRGKLVSSQLPGLISPRQGV